MIVAAMKELGRGKVYYFGTNLGASIAAGSQHGIELLRAIVTPVAPPQVTCEKLRPRLVQGHERALLVIFNDTASDQTDMITLPSGYNQCRDIYSGKEFPRVNEKIQITVPYEDAVVLLLSS